MIKYQKKTLSHELFFKRKFQLLSNIYTEQCPQTHLHNIQTQTIKNSWAHMKSSIKLCHVKVFCLQFFSSSWKINFFVANIDIIYTTTQSNKFHCCFLVHILLCHLLPRKWGQIFPSSLESKRNKILQNTIVSSEKLVLVKKIYYILSPNCHPNFLRAGDTNKK